MKLKKYVLVATRLRALFKDCLSCLILKTFFQSIIVNQSCSPETIFSIEMAFEKMGEPPRFLIAPNGNLLLLNARNSFILFQP